MVRSSALSLMGIVSVLTAFFVDHTFYFIIVVSMHKVPISSGQRSVRNGHCAFM